MNSIYFTLVLASLVGVSLGAGCADGPGEFKRPEECCKFQLIPSSVFEACKDGHKPHDGKNGKGHGSRQPGDPIKGSCRIECAFNQTGLYNGKQLNEDKIRKTFIGAVNGNAALVTAVTSSITTCLATANKRAAEFKATVTKGQNKCDPITTFAFMCITSNLMAKCPADLFDATDASCVNVQKYFIACPNGPQ